MAAVNQSMTVLESAIARSEFHGVLESKLLKHEKAFGRQKRKVAIRGRIEKSVIKTIDKSKKTTSGPASKSTGTSKSSQASKPTETAQSSEATKSGGTAASAKTPSKDPGTEDQAGLKFWDVGGYQVKPFKNWIQVRIDSDSIRKFDYKEWQNADIAKQIATEFAKEASHQTLLFRTHKNKKDKTEFMKERGVDMTGKETQAGLEKLLHKAGNLKSIIPTTTLTCNNSNS